VNKRLQIEFEKLQKLLALQFEQGKPIDEIVNLESLTQVKLGKTMVNGC